MRHGWEHYFGNGMCRLRGIGASRGLDNNLAAAYEVDDLQAISLSEGGFCPMLAGNDVSVQFDGYSIRFHSQLVDKTGERERRGKIAGFAIDVQLHVIWIFAAGARPWQVSCRAPLDLTWGGCPHVILLSFHFAEVEFAGCGAPGVVGLDKHGRIRE
jgi:hypothetical protein